MPLWFSMNTVVKLCVVLLYWVCINSIYIVYYIAVADELLRGQNDIGKWTLAQLEKKGVDVTGCESK